MARTLCPGPNWVLAVIKRQLRPVTYLVSVESGQTWKHHADQLKDWTVPLSELDRSREVVSRPRRLSGQSSTSSDSSEAENYSVPYSTTATEEQAEEAIEDSDNVVSDASAEIAEEPSDESSDEVSGEHLSVGRFPSQVRAKPDWYHPYHC